MMAQWIVFLPLAGAILAGLLNPFAAGHARDRFAQLVTIAFMVVCALLSWVEFLTLIRHGAEGMTQIIPLLDWVKVGDFTFNWALRVDSLTRTMFVVVTTVSCLVHIYSVGYMSDDPSKPRFMAYLSLFSFMMLMLVSANNLVQMFFGWEGVGLASYLLIGFWYQKPSANAAAIKAFLVNRVGDVGFALGIFAMFWLTGSVEFEDIFAKVADLSGMKLHFLGGEFDAITCVALLLFLGAMGKSAQLGLHTWLPDAMEGPTPVSALIHAATMVTAGVFMVCRLSPWFEYSETALTVVTIVGASTAFFAATVGVTQTDIKRVIAYSTCSQLGYMFFAAGVSAYQAAMFHLLTHAFFKAMLFLGAGSVIHALGGEQDMLRMGGVGKKIRQTQILMWIGSLALAGIGIQGVFGFAGFYSKDMILEAEWASHGVAAHYAFWLGVAAAFLTAFYSWRLLILTFDGTARGDHHVADHAHESPPVMLFPLYVLAIGAVLSGFLLQNYLVGEHQEQFWGEAIKVLASHEVLEHAHHVPQWVKLAPLLMGLLGISLAYFVYGKGLDRARRWAVLLQPLYQISFRKWYFDEIYDALWVRPALWLGRQFWQKGDGALIDGYGPNGISALALRLAKRVSQWQTGYLYHYALIMMGSLALLTAFLLTR